MAIDGFINHIERHLGTIRMGWSCEQEVSIVQFEHQPCQGATTYATLGLHRHLLRHSCKEYRHELLMPVWERYPDEDIVYFMQQFVRNVILRHHQPLLRGEVIGPSTPIIPGSSLTAIYAAVPVLFADTLWEYHGTTPPTVFIWLLPIHADEAAFVAYTGWNAFEDRLVQHQPDLLDMQREGVV